MANAICLLYDMCRFCLDEPGIHNIHNQKMIQDIFLCTNISQISANDHLPPKICNNCINKIEASKDLRHYATKNDLYMRSILSNSNKLEEIAHPKVLLRLEEAVSSSTGNEAPPKKQAQKNKDNELITQTDSSPEEAVSRMPKSPVKKIPRISVRSLEDINSNRSISVVVSSSKNDQSPPKKNKVKRSSSQSDKSIDNQEHTCDVCNKTYSTPKKLYLHKRSHTKSLHCPLDNCSKKFATKGDLLKHTRSHTGEKPYQCDLCEKRFTQNVSLKAHIATIHSNSTDFE